MLTLDTSGYPTNDKNKGIVEKNKQKTSTSYYIPVYVNLGLLVS